MAVYANFNEQAKSLANMTKTSGAFEGLQRPSKIASKAFQNSFKGLQRPGKALQNSFKGPPKKLKSPSNIASKGFQNSLKGFPK